MSYSIDFRKHVFKIKDRDTLTFHRTGERFGISSRTLFKWKKCMEPKLHRNKPATKIDMEDLQKHVEDCPDSYRHERAAHFGASSSCILYALRRLGISNKKHCSIPNQTPPKELNLQQSCISMSRQNAVRLFIWMRVDFPWMSHGIADTVSEGRDAMVSGIGTVKEERMRSGTFIILKW